jgi:uncharacterized protein (DUF952 family)
VTDRIAYKILTEAGFAALQTGVFAGAPVDFADGYIHLSSAAQVTGTVKKHFSGEAGLVVAAVDLAVLGDAVRWEPARDGQLFPHLYGELPLSAVIAAAPLAWDDSGAVRLPA